MKNLQTQCEHPAIILNPHLKDLILKYKHYYIRGKRHELTTFKLNTWYMEFPYHLFSKIKRSIEDPTEVQDFYIQTEDEPALLFLVVPCGKCCLCTEKKANDWVTRAMCESQTSSSVPLFVTLTYNNFCLPWNGVRKGAAQRFIKRLRINLKRYLGYDSKLRYYICAEYGTKTGRPHYHALLWNMPVLEASHIDELIQKSWSFQVNKSLYDKIPNDKDSAGNPIYKYYDEKADTHRVLFGYPKVYTIKNGGIQYCMKYMRKEATIPTGKNKVFFLASRRGGLGSEWINKFAQEYRNNPSLLDVQLHDIWTDTDYKGCIPKYFKDKIAPSPSRIIKKEIRDTFKLWNYYSNKFHSQIMFHYTPNPNVITHYPALHYHKAQIYGINTFNVKHGYPNDSQDTAKIVDYLEHKLLSYQYDRQLSIDVPIYKRKHLVHIENFINSSPPVDLNDKIASIHRRRKRSQLREIF